MKSYEEIKQIMESFLEGTPPNPDSCTIEEAEQYFGNFMKMITNKPHYEAKKYPEFSKVYECDGYTCDAHPKGCFFCKHLTDIYVDPFSGPYGWVCELHNKWKQVIKKGLFGKCKDFEEKN